MIMLLYDGDCPLCINAVHQLRRWGLLATVQALPWHTAIAEHPQLNHPQLVQRIQHELLLLEGSPKHHPPGTAIPPHDVFQPADVWGGWQAIAHLMKAQSAVGYPLLGRLMLFPGIRTAGEHLYKMISKNRMRLLKSSPDACACVSPKTRRNQA